MKNARYSLITIAYNRTTHLVNMLRGLRLGSEYPDEVIIVLIGNTTFEIEEDFPFDIRCFSIEIKQRRGLPIGQARNLGAEKALYSKLIFLDVDCIASRDFIKIMKRQSNEQDGIIMGTPKYLKTAIPPNFDESILKAESVMHPHRPVVTKLQQESTYELFWSLCFYISKQQFLDLGGFDDNYGGYGGEDTDLSFKAREKKCPFYLSQATVYHQQHAFCKPPLDQFTNIIENCNYFYRKWGIWPMDNHLEKFQEMNLIAWEPKATENIVILSKPSDDDIKSSRITDLPYA